RTPRASAQARTTGSGVTTRTSSIAGTARSAAHTVLSIARLRAPRASGESAPASRLFARRNSFCGTMAPVLIDRASLRPDGDLDPSRPGDREQVPGEAPAPRVVRHQRVRAFDLERPPRGSGARHGSGQRPVAGVQDEDVEKGP